MGKKFEDMKEKVKHVINSGSWSQENKKKNINRHDRRKFSRTDKKKSVCKERGKSDYYSETKYYYCFCPSIPYTISFTSLGSVHIQISSERPFCKIVIVYFSFQPHLITSLGIRNLNFFLSFEATEKLNFISNYL